MIWRYLVRWDLERGALRVPLGSAVRAQAFVAALGAGRAEAGTAVFQGRSILSAALALDMPAEIQRALEVWVRSRTGRGVEASDEDKINGRKALDLVRTAVAVGAHEAEKALRSESSG